MAGRLKHKVIVVIGGTSGFGLAAASAFLAEGARVVVVGREPERSAEARHVLGRRAMIITADATDPQAARQAIALAREKYSGFDGLYHVAGGSGRRYGDGLLHEVTAAGWDYTLSQNLTSLFYSNRAAVQEFLQRGQGGTIVNMGSVLGFSPAPHYFGAQAYATAKAAIIGFTQTAAATYAKDRIRFNVLAPALTATPMSGRAQNDADILQYIGSKQPLHQGCLGLPTDLDALAVYFMSDASRWVTGQVVAVDGGWSVSEGQWPAANQRTARVAKRKRPR